jgi:AbrB family looped-hinge helix DNA binding protein
METVKVSSKGQVVIPKSLRESHRIHTGDSFIITAVGDELHLKPAPTAGQSSLKSVAGMLHRPGTEKLSDKQLEQRISARLRDEDKASKSR